MDAHNDTPSAPLPDQQIPAALTDPQRGGGDYPPYGYLWHLGAAEVLDLGAAADGDYTVDGAVWFDERLRHDPARIALVDTGLADHPNLEAAVLRDLSVDLGSHEGGAAYLRRGEKWDDFLVRFGVPAGAAPRGQREPRGVLSGLADAGAARALIDSLDVALAQERLDALVGEVVRRVRRGVVLRDLSAQDQRYPAHGTASAGLLVGSPRFVAGKAPDEAEFAAGSLPYFGVDPWSRVIPIATSFEPEPMQLTLALLYACANGADVIHMPRGSDNFARAPRPDPRPSQPPTRYGEDPRWDLFEAVLLAVSRRIPIVCAAGNMGDDRLGYPASLATADGGRNGVIAVGAVTALGRRAGYSNYGPGLTLVAPSNDSRVYTRHQMRLDPRDRTSSSHNWAIHEHLDGGYVEFSHPAPMTVDVPGPRGYRGGVAARPEDFSRADYTLFGGTSAASAIVAGIVALMCRAMPSAHDAAEAAATKGLMIKEALVVSARHEVGGKPLRPDISNESDLALEPAELARRNFGAGVVNAPGAIDEICRRI